MPKVKTIEKEKDKERLLVKVIKGGQAYTGRTNEEVAECLGICRNTLSSKMQKPSKFSIAEIRKLTDYLAISKEEIANAIWG